jgi:hypothetical protein
MVDPEAPPSPAAFFFFILVRIKNVRLGFSIKTFASSHAEKHLMYNKI